MLEALERLGDDRYRVLMFGTREFDELRDRDRRPRPLGRSCCRTSRSTTCRELVAAADLACVIQDPAHPVSRYQMPAKVTDALAMGVPCLVTPSAAAASR